MCNSYGISISCLGMHANNKEKSSAESGDDLIIQMIEFQRAADVTPRRFSHMLQTVFVVLASSPTDLDFRRLSFCTACSSSLKAAAGLLVLQRVLKLGSVARSACICLLPSQSGHRGGDLYAAVPIYKLIAGLELN